MIQGLIALVFGAKRPCITFASVITSGVLALASGSLSRPWVI
jgi:hypothetical protein